MVNSVRNIIARSLFCSPDQFDTPGRILVTDCYWTTAFDDCVQFFQLNSRFIFVIPFRWAPLFQPILEKVRVGSGLDPQVVLELLSDRKNFQELCIEGVTDLFVNCDDVHYSNEPPPFWCKAYPLKYSRWLDSVEEYTLNLEENSEFAVGCLSGVDFRQISSLKSLKSLLDNLNVTDSFHLLLSTDLRVAIQPLLTEKHFLVTRHRISWKIN